MFAQAGPRPRPHDATVAAEAPHHSDARHVRFAATVAALATLRARVGRTALRLAPRRPRRSARRKAVDGSAVRALAGSGASGADIARRTGLGRDAVALALYLG